MDNTGSQSAPRFLKAQADKKYIKRFSNAFSVPLICEQIVGTIVIIFAGIIVIAIRVSVMHDAGSFSLSTFLSFLSQSNNSDVLNNIFSTLSYFAYMFIPFAVIAAVLRQNPLKVIPTKFKHPELILPAILVGLSFSIIGELYSGYFAWLLQIIHLKVNLPQFSFPNNTPALVVYFIQISIFAPICEEAIFRGMILQNLRRYGNFFAVIVSSLMFGLLHGNLDQTPFAFIVGLACAVTVVETGSIFASMLLHCCVNSSSLIFTAIDYYIKGNTSTIAYTIYAIVICALAITSIIFLYKKHFFKDAKKRYFSDSMPAPRAFTTFITTPGFIIFLIFYISIMPLTLKLL